MARELTFEGRALSALALAEKKDLDGLLASVALAVVVEHGINVFAALAGLLLGADPGPDVAENLDRAHAGADPGVERGLDQIHGIAELLVALGAVAGRAVGVAGVVGVVGVVRALCVSR